MKSLGQHSHSLYKPFHSVKWHGTAQFLAKAQVGAQRSNAALASGKINPQLRV